MATSEEASLLWGLSTASRVSKGFIRPQDETTSSRTSEITDLDLSRDLSDNRFSESSTADDDPYLSERLFLLCHGCIGTLMVRFGRECNLSVASPLVKPGHSTVVLTTCRKCLRRMPARQGPELAKASHLADLFQLVSLSPAMMEQMHAFQVMQIVCGGKVLILTHNGAVAYETWDIILGCLPGDCVCSGIDTDMHVGLQRNKLIMPYVPVALM